MSGVSGFRGRFWLAAASPFLPLTQLDGVTGLICDDKHDTSRRPMCLKQSFSNRMHKKYLSDTRRSHSQRGHIPPY
jgi:hypothetical protein